MSLAELAADPYFISSLRANCDLESSHAESALSPTRPLVPCKQVPLLHSMATATILLAFEATHALDGYYSP